MALFAALSKQTKCTIFLVLALVAVALLVRMNKLQNPSLIEDTSTIDINSVALNKPRTPATLVDNSLSQAETTLSSSESRHIFTPGISSEQSLVPPLDSYSCQDRVCSELLSMEEKNAYRKCGVKKSNVDIKPAMCHFKNSTGRVPVALSSFPGSGNTWVRGLLEQSTGICTGSIYCDATLKSQGFAGEHVTTGAVLAVKMHKLKTVQTKEVYGAAIHLVRNPFGALVAEYNREKTDRSSPGGKHVNSVEKERFGNSSEWREYLARKARKWKSHFISWTQKEPDIPVLHVRYEDIKEDRVREVRRMMEFLGVPYSEAELKERLSEDFDLFHRNKHEDFDPYTPEQREYVNQQIREAVESLRRNNNEDYSLGLGVSAYLVSA